MIRSITMKDFRGQNKTIQLDHETNLKCVNGGGKSTILEAIVFSLMGCDSNGKKAPIHLISIGAPKCEVIIEMEKSYISRTLNYKSKTGTLKRQMKGNSEWVELGQENLTQVLGDSDTFISTIKPGFFFSRFLTAPKRLQIMSNLLPKVDRLSLFEGLVKGELNEPFDQILEEIYQSFKSQLSQSIELKKIITSSVDSRRKAQNESHRLKGILDLIQERNSTPLVETSVSEELIKDYKNALKIKEGELKEWEKYDINCKHSEKEIARKEQKQKNKKEKDNQFNNYTKEIYKILEQISTQFPDFKKEVDRVYPDGVKSGIVMSLYKNQKENADVLETIKKRKEITDRISKIEKELEIEKDFTLLTHLEAKIEELKASKVKIPEEDFCGSCGQRITKVLKNKIIKANEEIDLKLKEVKEQHTLEVQKRQTVLELKNSLRIELSMLSMLPPCDESDIVENEFKYIIPDDLHSLYKEIIDITTKSQSLLKEIEEIDRDVYEVEVPEEPKFKRPTAEEIENLRKEIQKAELDVETHKKEKEQRQSDRVYFTETKNKQSIEIKKVELYAKIEKALEELPTIEINSQKDILKDIEGYEIKVDSDVYLESREGMVPFDLLSYGEHNRICALFSMKLDSLKKFKFKTVFIDNAESISEEIKSKDIQIIKAYVTKDKELQIEVKDVSRV